MSTTSRDAERMWSMITAYWAERMWNMISGYWVSQVVRATAKLGLAEILADGPAKAEEVARLAGTHPDATTRLLRCCASLGLVAYQAETAEFSRTPLLAMLLQHTPGSQYGTAVGLTGPAQYRPWTELAEAVRTGKPQTPNVLGADLWDYYQDHADEAADFTAAMTSLTALSVGAVASVIDTTSVTTAVDVGGAAGALVLELMRLNPRLSGIVLDRPQVVPAALELARQRQLQHRFNAVSGDFLESIPKGDLFLLKFILHDWNDETCIRILRNCRAAMQPGGRVLVIEMLLGEIGREPPSAPLMDVNMLLHLSGRERTVTDYDRLLYEAGLRVNQVLRTESPFSVIQAIAP